MRVSATPLDTPMLTIGQLINVDSAQTRFCGQGLNFKNMIIWSLGRLSAPLSHFSHNGNLSCASFPRCAQRKNVQEDVRRVIKVISTQNWM